MAKATWCTVTPTSGKENGTINISAAAHTGRSPRSTSVTVQAVNGTKPSASIAVSQAAAVVTTTMDTTKPDLPAIGGVVTINGTSNSSKLVFIEKVSVSGLPLPNLGAIIVKVNNVEISSNTAIPGDPGATERYNFVVTATYQASPFPKDVLITFELSDDTGTKKTCVFTLKAGASSLSVNKNTLSLVNAGTAQPISVTSNDDWTVS